MEQNALSVDLVHLYVQQNVNLAQSMKTGRKQVLANRMKEIKERYI